MNVAQLRELIENLDGEVEVRLMTQPNYIHPFEYSIAGVVGLDEIHDFQAEDYSNPDNEFPVEFYEPQADYGYGFSNVPYGGPGILYILEGTQLSYGTSDAWTAMEDHI